MSKAHRASVASLLDNRFDGDTASLAIAYSDEAIAEAERFFKMKKAYIGTDGELLYSTSVDTVELVLHSLTGDPEQ